MAKRTKKPKKTYEQLEAELTVLKRGNNASALASTIIAGFRYGFASFAVYGIYKSIEALAGKTTIAMFLTNFLVPFQV